MVWRVFCYPASPLLLFFLCQLVEEWERGKRRERTEEGRGREREGDRRGGKAEEGKGRESRGRERGEERAKGGREREEEVERKEERTQYVTRFAFTAVPIHPVHTVSCQPSEES